MFQEQFGGKHVSLNIDENQEKEKENEKEKEKEGGRERESSSQENKLHKDVALHKNQSTQQVRGTTVLAAYLDYSAILLTANTTSVINLNKLNCSLKTCLLITTG